jgi:hypothetical protein
MLTNVKRIAKHLHNQNNVRMFVLSLRETPDDKNVKKLTN